MKAFHNFGTQFVFDVGNSLHTVAAVMPLAVTRPAPLPQMFSGMAAELAVFFSAPGMSAQSYPVAVAIPVLP